MTFESHWHCDRHRNRNRKPAVLGPGDTTVAVTRAHALGRAAAVTGPASGPGGHCRAAPGQPEAKWPSDRGVLRLRLSSEVATDSPADLQLQVTKAQPPGPRG